MICHARVLHGAEAEGHYRALGWALPSSIAGFRCLPLNKYTRRKIPPHHEDILAAFQLLRELERGDEERFLIVTAHLREGLSAFDIVAFQPSWLDVANSQIILYPGTDDELAIDVAPWFCARIAANGGVIASGSASARRRKCSDAAKAVREGVGMKDGYKPLEQLVTYHTWYVTSTYLPVPAMSRLRHETIGRTEGYRAHKPVIVELLQLWDESFPPFRALPTPLKPAAR